MKAALVSLEALSPYERSTLQAYDASIGSGQWVAAWVEILEAGSTDGTKSLGQFVVSKTKKDDDGSCTPGKVPECKVEETLDGAD
eukprot:3140139-Karenia_brevis.AAC.1